MPSANKSKSLRHEEDEAAVIQALRRLFKAVHLYSKCVLRSTGLSGPQLWALNILQETSALSLSELAARMYAHPSTVSGVVDRLVRRGAIQREVYAADRREIRLTLTETGKNLVAKSPTPVQSALTKALSGMSPVELRQLRASLEEVARATETDNLDAPFFDLD